MNDELRLKIESYLGDTMSPEEAMDFESQMKNDPLLKEEVRRTRQINAHLSDNSINDEVSEE